MRVSKLAKKYLNLDLIEQTGVFAGPILIMAESYGAGRSKSIGLAPDFRLPLSDELLNQ